MIRVTIRTNGNQNSVFAETTDTIKGFFEKNNVDMTGANVMLNGMTVMASELGKTFADFGIDDNDNTVMISAIVKMSAAFDVKLDTENGNVLTVLTDIERETIEDTYQKYTDEETGEEYLVAFDENCPTIDENFFKGNAFINDKLACVSILPVNTTEDDVKKILGNAILNAQKYTTKIAEQATAKKNAVNALFA